MKAYLDALSAVGVLTAKQAEWQEDVTFYHINNGFEIIAFDVDGIEFPVTDFEFDGDAVIAKTASPASDSDGWWNVEITITDKSQLLIKRVTIVTLEELQG